MKNEKQRLFFSLNLSEVAGSPRCGRVVCAGGGGEEKTERREEYEKSVKAQKNRQNGGLSILVGDI